MICFRKRLRISSAVNEDARLPDDLKAHLERCDSCRRHYERQKEVAALLQQPVDEKIKFPSRLNESIMRTIREEPTGTGRDSRRNLSPWLAPAALASVALLAALVLVLRNPEPDRPVIAGGEPVPLVPPVALSGPAPSTYIRSWSVAIDRPLDNEIEKVVADTRAAVRFLAVNFLPEDRSIENL